MGKRRKSVLKRSWTTGIVIGVLFGVISWVFHSLIVDGINWILFNWFGVVNEIIGNIITLLVLIVVVLIIIWLTSGNITARKGRKIVRNITN